MREVWYRANHHREERWLETKHQSRKKNNQAFCYVPTYLLLEKIKYKAAIEGLKLFSPKRLILQNHLSLTVIHCLSMVMPSPQFSGKRKYRGLYVSNGFAVNADVNGSLNIGRKVIPEFLGIGDRSLAARPVVVNPLKV